MVASLVLLTAAQPDLSAFGFEGVPLFGALVALALLDSMSFGTLLIPIWLLLTPGRVRAGRLVVYLGTIVVFYFAVGLLLAIGASSFVTQITAALETPFAGWAQLVLGSLLLVFSFTITPKKGAESGKLARWRARAMGVVEPEAGLPGNAAAGVSVAQRSTVVALMTLALTAAAIEAASMLPYLAGIGLISASGVGWPGSGLLIAGYCIVMVLPALILLAGRLLAATAIEPLLTRLGDWLARHAAESTAWIVGIIGFLLARDAATRLGIFTMFGG